MHTHTLTARSLFAVGFIFICTAAGWFFLGGSMTYRSTGRAGPLVHEVKKT